VEINGLLHLPDVLSPSKVTACLFEGRLSGLLSLTGFGEEESLVALPEIERQRLTAVEYH
jgi:hypothetical protein